MVYNQHTHTPSMDSKKGNNHIPSVTLPQGTIEGFIETEPDFPQPVECYLGFPYAQAPVANLRFRPPVKLDASTRVFKAFQYGAAAPGVQLIPPRIKLHFS